MKLPEKYWGESMEGKGAKPSPWKKRDEEKRLKMKEKKWYEGELRTKERENQREGNKRSKIRGIG